MSPPQQGNLLTRRFSPAKSPAPKERDLHFAVANLLRTYGHPDWRWNHPGGGELRDGKTGAKLKRMGLKAGRPDFEGLSPRTPERPGGLFHGLELKVGSNGLTEEQQEFADWCEANGVPFAVVRSVPEALDVLGGWGALRIRVRDGRIVQEALEPPPPLLEDQSDDRLVRREPRA